MNDFLKNINYVIALVICSSLTKMLLNDLRKKSMRQCYIDEATQHQCYVKVLLVNHRVKSTCVAVNVLYNWFYKPVKYNK